MAALVLRQVSSNERTHYFHPEIPKWIKEIFPWTKAKLWPHVRSGHRCVATDTHLFVYGGFDPWKTYGEFWAFNLTTREWELISNECSPFSASSSLILLHDNIFIFGGSGYPFGQTNSDKFSCYSLRTRNWTDLDTCTKGDKPVPRYGASVAVNSAAELYLYSGTNGTHFFEDLYCFDLRSLEWTTVESKGTLQPEPRYRHEVVCFENRFYVFGGSTLARSFGFEEVYVFDCKTRTWSKTRCQPCNTHGFPPPRKGHSCVLFKGKVYMACGICNNTTYDEPLDDLWRINLKDMKWEKLNIAFPYRMYFHAAAMTPAGCMYVFGGIQESSGQDMSTWKRTSDLFHVWVDVPPLLELSWRLVYNLYCSGDTTDVKVLRTLGLPNYLLNRLNPVLSEQ